MKEPQNTTGPVQPLIDLEEIPERLRWALSAHFKIYGVNVFAQEHLKARILGEITETELRQQAAREASYAEICEHCKAGLRVVGGQSYYAHEDGRPVTADHCGLVGCGASHVRMAYDRALAARPAPATEEGRHG